MEVISQRKKIRHSLNCREMVDAAVEQIGFVAELLHVQKMEPLKVSSWLLLNTGVSSSGNLNSYYTFIMNYDY